jgi:competence protein ComEC
MLRSVITRFRAYQLGTEGSSFSYYADGHFTLIEARLSETNTATVGSELAACNKELIDCLHITSWDRDHCEPGELETILHELAPSKVEYPGYEPHSKTAEESLRLISAYVGSKKRPGVAPTKQKVDPSYIKSLSPANSFAYNDVIYHPQFLSEDSSNDNSTVKLFRRGCFNVASLGDVESQEISQYLRESTIFKGEVDVMILAHHGADNGFTTKKFLERVRPTVAVCSSNYDNQFDHPRQEIRDLLHQFDIPIYTTKTGDVVIQSIEPHKKRFRVINLQASSEEVSSVHDYTSKKSNYLVHNNDTLRDRIKIHPKWPK